jgi:ribosomal protein S12 methylthiotransferase
MKEPMGSPTRVAFVSLGCAKNTVDSEKMLGQLAEAGCVITADESDAEAIVVNTCGFLQASRTEADEILREVILRKKDGVLKRVIAAGCLVQRDKEALALRVPGIDALVGVNNRDDIVRAVVGKGSSHKRQETDLFLSDYHAFTQMDNARMRITPKHYAYLRISEGCDQKCTFCTIPSIRGPMHCKPPEVILDEARELISDGAVELNLIGQDTTSYGRGADQFGVGLADLLRQLDRVEGAQWIRLMYVYPSVLSNDILDAMADCNRVCNYIDIPLQHISDRVLKSMHRGIDRRGTEALLDRIRQRIPGVAVRTTLIAGFPGETDAEFEELIEFIKDFRFDALGVFPYSLEADTPAGRMKGQLPEAVKEQRVDALMRTQQEIAFRLAEERVGSTFEVLVDGRVDDQRVSARHRGQAPMVDSATYVRGNASAGELVSVRCVARDAYDLVAVPTQSALPVL